jgi:hypothetical protein
MRQRARRQTTSRRVRPAQRRARSSTPVPDAVACLQNEHARSAVGEVACGTQPGQSGTDHDHIDAVLIGHCTLGSVSGGIGAGGLSQDAEMKIGDLSGF